MTRLFRRRFLKTSLLAFSTSLILIPAASAMPVISDPAAASASAVPIVSPFDAVFHATPAQTGDGWYTAATHRPGPVAGVDLTVPTLSSSPSVSPSDGRDWQPFGLALALSAALVALLALSRRSVPRPVPIVH
jgi:hypothetical protein